MTSVEQSVALDGQGLSPRREGRPLTEQSQATGSPARGPGGMTVVLFATYPIAVPRHGGQIRCAQIVKALQESGLDVTTISVVDVQSYPKHDLGSLDLFFPADSACRLFRGKAIPDIND